MSLEYTDTLKHFKKITNNKSIVSNPALKGVHHKKDVLLASDGFRILQVEVRGKDFEETVININDDSEIDVEYPNAERLFINDNEVEHVLFINEVEVLKLKKVLSFIKSLGIEKIDITNVDDNWYLEPAPMEDLNISLKYKFCSNQIGDQKKRSFKTKYLLDAVEFIRSTKESTQFHMTENYLRPVQFKSYDYTYLLAPCR